MPYFNANPGPSLAASIASRYGRVRSAREAAREKANQRNPKDFVYKPPSDSFVFFYPRAPSFESQIDRAEKQAHAAVMNDAVKYAQERQQQQRQSLPPAMLASPSAARSPNQQQQQQQQQQRADENEQQQLLLAQPQAVAPFAVDSGRGSFASPNGGGASRKNNNAVSSQNTEYRTEFTARGNAAASTARVPVDRRVEIILQRGGMSNLRSKAGAAHPPQITQRKEQQPHHSIPHFTNKAVPEVALSMQPPPASYKQDPRNGPRVMYYRPKSAMGRNDIAPQPRTAADQSPSSSNVSNNQKRRPASASAVAHNSVPSSAPQTSTGARAASPAVRRSQSVASCGSARYHVNCTQHQPRGYQSKPQSSATDRRRSTSSAAARRSHGIVVATSREPVVAPIDELPSTRKFVAVQEPEQQQLQQQHHCGCPCHALQQHDKAQRAMFASPNMRRQLYRAPNYQTKIASTRDGVGACLEWPVDAVGTKLN